jgi:peptidoglycan/LPS O-acetylase OafA/YrhL
MATARIGGIDLLRCCSAVLIYSFHYTTLFDSAAEFPEFVSSIRKIGPIGTNLFLLLAGYFCIRTTATPMVYAVRRCIRLLVPLWALLLCYAVLFVLDPSRNRIPEAPLQAALYLAINFLGLAGFTPLERMVTVTWTVTYVLWPAILVVFLRNKRSAWLWLALAAAGLVWFRVRLVYFFMGAALGAEHPGVRLAAIIPALVNLPAAICLALFAAIRRFSFENALISWFAGMSYSFYLCHSLGLYAASLLELPLSYVTGFLMSVLLASILYRLVEKPSRTLSETMTRYVRTDRRTVATRNPGLATPHGGEPNAFS